MKDENEIALKSTDPFIQKHLNRIKLITGLLTGKRFFVECYPTDTGATHFPNSNFAVKEIIIPASEEQAGDTVPKQEYDNACEEIGRLQHQLDEANQYIKELKIKNNE